MPINPPIKTKRIADTRENRAIYFYFDVNKFSDFSMIFKLAKYARSISEIVFMNDSRLKFLLGNITDGNNLIFSVPLGVSAARVNSF